MKTKNIPRAVALSSAGWVKIEEADKNRVGLKFQNHSGQAGTPTAYVADGEPSDIFRAIEVPPSGAVVDDYLCGTGEIWGYASGAMKLTYIVQYEDRG